MKETRPRWKKRVTASSRAYSQDLSRLTHDEHPTAQTSVAETRPENRGIEANGLPAATTRNMRGSLIGVVACASRAPEDTSLVRWAAGR